jgi:excisionase family DNA binding protein
MLTVPEAARRVGRDPETIRRWIRSGRLRARKIGTQHVIEEEDLQAATSEPELVGLPEAWKYTHSGRPMPNVVAAIHSLAPRPLVHRTVH